jgi:glucose-1-phosphate thymidylyltransferase
VKAIILAAGYGTRLYPITKNLPKSLLPIVDTPLLSITMNNILEIKEIDEVVVVSNNKFFKNFQHWLSSQEYKSKNVVLLDDGTTGNENRLGAIRDLLFAIQSRAYKDSYLVLAGDNLYDFKLSELVMFYEKRKKNVVAVKDIKDKNLARNYGVVVLDENSKIKEFQEKPVYPETSLIAICAYVFTPDIETHLKEYIASGNNIDAPGYFLEWLCRREEVYAFTFSAAWFDIGDIHSYRNAQEYYRQKFFK